MAQQKATLILQSGHESQPIDYRDIVRGYDSPNQIQGLLQPCLLHIVKALQATHISSLKVPSGLLQKLDIGDCAAENEIRSLKSYFVSTGQFLQAQRGYARLVVGRKGSGKTAIFYGVRDSIGSSRNNMVLDLKPEGHQFLRLREVIGELSPGLQEHTMTAFWNAILLAEIAHKIRDSEASWAYRDPNRRDRYEMIVSLYDNSWFAEEGDFSQRLLKTVTHVSTEYSKVEDETAYGKVTEKLFRDHIRKFGVVVGEYLKEKSAVWLLVDNLDKGWPTRGASPQDILIIRAFLEATRKLQRELEKQDVSFHCLMFLRNDIYDHLIVETPDKDKDTPIILDWPDKEFFKEIFRLRVLSSGQLPDDTFESLWSSVFASHVGTYDSFEFVIERTLMRPRDFLTFLHRAIETAVNRGHDTVLEEDLKYTEGIVSEDLLRSTGYELEGVFPEGSDFLYGFIGCNEILTEEEASLHLMEGGLAEDKIHDALELIAWFGFLGVQRGNNDPQYSFEVRYDLKKLLSPIRQGSGHFVVHPAFRTALGCETER